MDAHKLLMSWPCLDALDASSILSHPAWKMPVGYAEDGMFLTLNAESSSRADELLLKITLDDAENVLGLSDSLSYPDLHLLWSRRAELPEALIVALVEKEVGTLLQAVEKLMQGELRLVGLAKNADNVSALSRRAFSLATPLGTSCFSICVPSDVERAVGVLDNLDPSHPAISSLKRSVRAEYAVVEIPAESNAPFAVGDFIILPDSSSSAWKMAIPADQNIRIMSAEETSFSFAQFVAETLPPVPSPNALMLFRSGRAIATAEVSSVGDAPAVKITSLIPCA